MALSAEKKPNVDDRGIQNVQTDFRYANDNIPRPHTVQTDNEKKLIGNQSIQKQKYTDKKSVENIEENTTQHSPANQALQRIRTQQQDNQVRQSVEKATSKGLGRSLLWISGIAALIQFSFATVSAALIGLQGVVDDYTEGNLVGWLLTHTKETVNEITDFFLGIKLLSSPLEVAMAFYVLSCIIVVALFLTYYILFRISGMRPFLGSVGSFWLTSLCLIFGFIPFLNILPWIPIWILIFGAPLLFLNR